MSLDEHSHSRKNLLTGEWVMVSPHRSLRPWQGQREKVAPVVVAQYDPGCYLCPGNERANGERNPSYSGSFAFNNDFPALSSHSEISTASEPLFEARTESGCCRVFCYSERHDLRFATMSIDDAARALSALVAEFSALDQSGKYAYVQVFENRGEMMGCSNQHPHAQIWATENLPNEPGKELATQSQYFQANQKVLLRDYLTAELKDRDRLVYGNDHFSAVVPYWAFWPFESLILPHRNIAAPDELTPEEIRGLADVMQTVMSAYDRMFDVSAPYSMGFHPRPSDGEPHPEWLLHAHVYPPLLRSATVRKHFVGFEMLGMPQRDLTPEVAAKRLRDCIST